MPHETPTEQLEEPNAFICVLKSDAHKGVTVLIEDESGTGYRLAGPKLVGNAITVIKEKITQRGASEIRHYLDHKFPVKPPIPVTDDIIKINVIPDQTCELYSPEGLHLGHIPNEYTFNDVRIQIMKNKLSGYYVLWTEEPGKEVRIDINSRGMLFFPEGFYSTICDQLAKL